MQRRAFVLMPFEDEFDDIYEYLIREPLSKAGYDVNRADEILNQENILSSIIDSIIHSELIVADLSTSNPNVYYELGLSHAYRKDVILITQEITEVPFDLRSYRIITYSTSRFTQMNKARRDIEKLLEDIQSGTTKFGSPVTDFGDTGNILTVVGKQNTSIDHHDEDESGFIDYRIAFEDNMKIINDIVTEVGERINTVTVNLEQSTNKLTNPEKLAPKEARKVMRTLAAYIHDYASWLQGSNNKYRQSLVDVGENLNAMISIEFVNTEEDREKIYEFIHTVKDVENMIQEARDTFSNVAKATDAMPRVEKEFNRSKRFMSDETKIFVDNIEQTLSVLVRARNAAMRILGKEDPKFEQS